MSTSEIVQESPDQPEIRNLLAELDAYYAGLYPTESNHLTDVATLLDPGTAFFVARQNYRVVGFGAMIAQREFFEMKRLFVAPESRGSGLGRRLVARLEMQVALASGGAGIAEERQIIRLETGIRQPAALALYRSCGYHEIAAFAPYLPDPLSVFFEKTIQVHGAKS